MFKNKEYVTLWFIAILLVVMSGCSGSSSSSSQQGTSPGMTGTLSVSLTDAPSSDVEAVYVTVSKVRVHQSATASENDPGWSEITLNPPREINLLKLTNGVLENLGQTPLPAGHYTQLRLVLLMNTDTSTFNSVVISNPTTTVPLKTPSAVQSGIKLIHEFDVAPGQLVDLVLDFDALKSIVKLGNGGYLLKPVIRVVPTALTGIDGFVATSLLTSNSNVMVSSQVSGTVFGSAIPNAQTGEFFIAHLDPGNYDVVITADGHATKVIAGVPVSIATSTALVTMVSTSAEPITLPTSTTHTIGGMVNLSTGPSPTTVASVVTMQTFSGGPTVTLKSQNVSPLPGNYLISLPSGTPLLGQYGTGSLPIAFFEEPEIAGKYDVEASADGYKTQLVPNVDISITDVIKNFTLTP